MFNDNVISNKIKEIKFQMQDLDISKNTCELIRPRGQRETNQFVATSRLGVFGFETISRT